MSSNNLEDAKDQLTNRARAGEKAIRFQLSEWSAWLEENIFKALDKEAITKMKLAKTDEDRIVAQQMFLAAEKPRALIEHLVRQGNGAIQELKGLYPTEDEK